MAKLIVRFNDLVKIREKELGRSLSQMQIANESGISQSTVSRWLSGKVDRTDFETLVRFCLYLNCQVGDLLVLELEDET